MQLAVMWEAKHKEEATKTEPLEEVCGELRDELDMAHKQRLDAFEIKMKPIVVREGPSRKVGGGTGGDTQIGPFSWVPSNRSNRWVWNPRKYNQAAPVTPWKTVASL